MHVCYMRCPCRRNTRALMGIVCVRACSCVHVYARVLRAGVRVRIHVSTYAYYTHMCMREAGAPMRPPITSLCDAMNTTTATTTTAYVCMRQVSSMNVIDATHIV